MVENRFNIKGITCNSCVEKLTAAFAEVEGVSEVQVSKSPGRVIFMSSGATDEQVVVDVLNKLDAKKYSIADSSAPQGVAKADSGEPLIKQLYPLALVISYLVATVLIIAVINSDFSLNSLMSHYMGGFFLIFSFFKFLNLQGFVDAFQTYDPLAKAFRPYGYFYAAYELVAGMMYLVAPTSMLLNLSVLVLLSISSIGVFNAVRSKTRIQCACLGTVFNLPMTKVTIVENAVMIVMALAMILR